jgi:6-pyruvoyltetrahydropterin/6-carboxytetrahydropterin synthase
MLTCKKTYADIPFAHRQHSHDGHCAFIHGHNWSISLTFACTETDENGFVIDFGKLGFIKTWINDNLDHACVFNEDDPQREVLINTSQTCWKPYVVDNCSCEGLAQHLFERFSKIVSERTKGRVSIYEVEVREDSKNSAAYSADGCS